MALTHRFETGFEDGPDGDKLQPSHWNDSHLDSVPHAADPASTEELEHWTRLDLHEHLADDDTDCLYHLHRGAVPGIVDDSVPLTTLTLYGTPTFVDDGMALSRTGKYGRTATTLDLGAASFLCLECWARWTETELANGESGYLLYWYDGADANNRVYIILAKTAGGLKQIQTFGMIGGVSLGRSITITDDQWAAIHARMCHFAVQCYTTGGAGGYARLFLDGVLLDDYAVSLGAIAAGGRYLNIGHPTASYTWGGYIDEVRLSHATRYSKAFAPPRYDLTHCVKINDLLHRGRVPLGMEL